MSPRSAYIRAGHSPKVAREQAVADLAERIGRRLVSELVPKLHATPSPKLDALGADVRAIVSAELETVDQEHEALVVLAEESAREPTRKAEGKLSASLSELEQLAQRAVRVSAACDGATDPEEIRSTSAQLARVLDLAAEADNTLGERANAWADAAAGAALVELRVLARPALSLLAAIQHAEAQGSNVEDLRSVCDWLDLKPELDPSSEAGQIAERVRKARDGLARAECSYVA
jgi:hypothetical protein